MYSAQTDMRMQEDFKIQVHCDLCGKMIENSKDHFRVDIEIYSHQEPACVTEEDLDQDHLEQIAIMLNDPDCSAPASTRSSFQFDLCPHCMNKYQKDPLSKEAEAQVHFSDN